MTSVRQNTASRRGWLTRMGLPGRLWNSLRIVLLCVMAFTASNRAMAFRGGAFHGGGQQQHSLPQSHPAPPSQPHPSAAPSHPQGMGGQAAPPRSGQHLPEWLNNHQHLSPQQQEDALRREPGFRNLPQDQQQRLVNRLHTLDSKTPEQRQRILARNETFERLSPQRQQEVRGASQALGQMQPDRQQAVRHAFQQLRRMPPQQRQLMLSSQGYGSQFSPQERTVLSNLLSIEPYSGGAIAQPYFGR